MSEMLRTIGSAITDAGIEDGLLLEAYRDHRDEHAFAELVRRHGPMVWGVCRRLLTNRQDAEDAFQATFLVLVRKPEAVRPPGQVGAWLHGVAVLAARKTLAATSRRRERQVESLPELVTVEDGIWHDLLPILDQAIVRLPAKYRLPIVLCDLEGNTRREAAIRLGWPEGTVAGRLALGRAMLARRLSRYGLAVSAGVVSVLFSSHNLCAAIPPSLMEAMAQVTANTAPEPAAVLAEGVIRAMWIPKLITTVAVVFVVAGSAILWAQAADQLQNAEESAKVQQAVAKEPAAVPTQKEDVKPAEAKEITLRDTIRGHDSMVLSLAYSPNGKFLASGSGFSPKRDWDVRLWDVATNKEFTILKGSEEPIDTMQFSPDNQLLATFGVCGEKLCIWNVAAGKKLHDLKGVHAVSSLSFHPDGKMLASGANYDVTRLWDITTGKELIRIEENSLCVTFTSDGKTLVYGTNIGGIRLWDVATRKGRTVLKTDASECSSLALSPDNKLIAFCGLCTKKPSDHSIRLYDFVGTEQRRLHGHTRSVRVLSFHPKGELLASAGEDRTVRVWDVNTGKQLISLPINAFTLAFSPDGKTLAVGSRDKIITLWDIPQMKSNLK